MSLSRSRSGWRWRVVLKRGAIAVALSVPLLVLAGLALTPLYPVPPFEAPSPGGDEHSPSYDELFPYYLEYAAMTRIKRRGHEPGGRHGHAAFYLKGVRRVDGATYPRLEILPENSDLSDPEAGVGVSVNKVFKNVNWAAFDGLDLFYTGGMREGDLIDANVRDVVIDRVLRTGALDGVEVHDFVLEDKPAGLRVERHIGEKSIGTDFALRFGRDLACVRIPVTREAMRRIVAYLNAMNARYAEGTVGDFEWSGVENNCTHLAVNALAEVFDVRRLETDTGRGRRLFHLAIPANVFVDLAVDGNKHPGEVDHAHLNSRLMLQQPGVIVRFLPRFRENNLLWEGDFDFYTMERPVVPLILVPPLQIVPIGSRWVWPRFYRFKQKTFRRLFTEPRYYDLAANLEYFRSFYRDELRRTQRPETASGDDDRQLSLDRYRSYLKEQLQRIDAAATNN